MKLLLLLLASLLTPAPVATDPMAPPVQGADDASAIPAADVAALRQRLADWRLAVELEGPSEQALAALLDLRTETSALVPTLPLDEQIDARELLADLHVQVLVGWDRTGDSAALGAEVLSLRLTATEPSVSAQRREAAKAALRRPEVAPILEQLTVAQRKAAIPPTDDASEDQVIAQAVRQAMQNGDAQFLNSLGSRALPELERLALLEEGSPRPEGEFDPLRRMMLVDRVRALDTATRLVGERPTLLVKRVVLDALRFGRALAYPEVWVPEGETGWRFRNPEWHDLFNRLVEEPALDANQMQDLLEFFIDRGVIPTGFQSAAFSRGPLGLTSPSVITTGHRALAVRCLESESARIRADAILTLAKSGDIREALPLFEDPSPVVRESLAKSLGPWTIQTWASSLRDDVVAVEVLPPVEEPGYQVALAALLEDGSERVWIDSKSSWRAVMGKLGSPVLPTEVCAGLVERAPEDRLEILTAMAGKGSENGTRAGIELVVKAGLNALPRTTWDSGPRRNYLVELLRLIGHDPELRWRMLQRLPELGLSEGDTARLLRGWANEDAGWAGLGEAYLTLLERLDSPLAWQEALSVASGPVHMRSAGEAQPWAQGLSDDLIGRAWLGASKHRAAIDWEQMAYLPVEPEVAARWIQDPRIAPEVRLARLPKVRGPWGERLTSEVLRALAAAVQEVTEASIHFKAFNLLPDDRRQDYLTALFEVPDIDVAGGQTRPAISDAWLLSLGVPRMRADTIDVVLDRFPPERFSLNEFASTYRSQLLESLLESMIASGESRYLPAIEAASRASALQVPLVRAIGSYRRGDLFELLTDVIRRVPQGNGAWNAGLAAVASFLDDRAMVFLLEHARETSEASYRERVMAHLDEVRRWQEASAQWERSKSERDLQRVAIARLVALLEDPATPGGARAEALRGLGLLGAVEELPRLIEALAAPVDELRNAAREAIDRLHGPERR